MQKILLKIKQLNRKKAGRQKLFPGHFMEHMCDQ